MLAQIIKFNSATEMDWVDCTDIKSEPELDLNECASRYLIVINQIDK